MRVVDHHASLAAALCLLASAGFLRAEESVGFTSEVVPALTRLGCNSGGCHGKAEGQNGFKLSLFGFEPADDYPALTQGMMGRRLNSSNPDQSLLLLKATGSVPHGGGCLTGVGSPHYAILRKWIAAGAPRKGAKEVPLTHIEVSPATQVLAPGGRVKITVTAHFQGGSKRDVTYLAQFKADPADLLAVDEAGTVTASQLPVSGAVMARYQDQVAVARILVPLGAPVANLPPVHNFIDELIAKQWKTMGIPPSPLCDDATFLRRVTIDVAGRLPSVKEVEEFTSSQDPKRYEKLVDRLLASDDYAYTFASKWSAVLRNRRLAPGISGNGTPLFHQWIFKSLKENLPFDAFAREVLTATGAEGEVAPIVWYRELKDANSLAEDAAQLFLGQRVQCARCHHHPSERWSQQDYWGLAAFFACIEVKMPASKKGKKDGSAEVERPTVVFKPGPARLTHPSTGAAVPAAALGAAPAFLAEGADPRAALADWMHDPANAFFARALVNRYWKHFLGRGLVEPEDDLRATNPPTNPELLDALAQHFVKSKFDLKALVRTICLSSTYRLSCEPNQHNAIDRQNYSHFRVRRLPAEVLLDAVDAVTLSKSNLGAPRAIQVQDNQVDSYFLRAFGRPDAASACECERSNGHSLAQALHLFNSDELLLKIGGPLQPLPEEPMPKSGGRKVAPKAGPNVAPGARLPGLVADPRPHDAKIRELFLTAFARVPTADETAGLVRHVERRESVQAAYADILWALLNSSEFAFNH